VIDSTGAVVARVYAQALFAIAKQKGIVDDVHDDLAVMRTALEKSPQFRRLLESPKVSLEQAERVIRDTFGPIAGTPAFNLLLLLIEKRRQGAFDRIVEEYSAMRDAERSERRATIATAAPLDDATRARIAGALGAKAGVRVLLEERVDPSLLGGVLVRVGDTLVDGTLRTALDRMARHIAQPNHDSTTHTA
jgi:F-type H+-transporting ATPase subunit delta